MTQVLFSGISPEQFLTQIVDAVKKEVILHIEKPQPIKSETVKFLTTKEACEFLKCSTTKLWRLKKSGDISDYGTGRNNLYKESDLENFVLKRGGQNA